MTFLMLYMMLDRAVRSIVEFLELRHLDRPGIPGPRFYANRTAKTRAVTIRVFLCRSRLSKPLLSPVTR